MNISVEDLGKKYDLELDKVISEIKKTKAKLVLLQFPDGLKSYAIAVVDYLEEKTDAEFLIWLGSCFGACDVPVLGKEFISEQVQKSSASTQSVKREKKIDLIVQFGHNSLQPSHQQTKPDGK